MKARRIILLLALLACVLLAGCSGEFVRYRNDPYNRPTYWAAPGTFTPYCGGR